MSQGSSYDGLIIVDSTISDGAFNGTGVINFNEEDKKEWGIGENQVKAPLTGAFFGEHAKEIAGEAHNGKWGVVFAAGKQ
ncbi:transferrin-binding protein-like solute binding protein [Testudinibacter sp. P80/BLE/0925]